MGRRSSGWGPPVRWGSTGGWARSSGWKTLALLTLGLGTACQRQGYAPQLVTAECSGLDPLEGVHYVRWRLTGPGMEPVERYVSVDEAVAHVPSAPEGTGRVLEVRGYTDLPSAGGQVVSVGRSHPFEVPGSSTAAVPQVSIALRRVGSYSHPPGAGGKCLTLAQERAGHTATLLTDGRVLLAGGYQLDSNGAPSTLTTTELFDPLGSLVQGPKLSEPRAFHTATRLPQGQVLLAGGEVDSTSRTLVSSSAEVFDVAQGAVSTVALQAARSHHAAAADAQGRVLLVGGTDTTGGVVAQAEGFEPSTGQEFAVATPVARVGLSVLAVGDGGRIAVVGGTDGTELRPEVLFFAYDGSSFVPSGAAEQLTEPRREGALVPFGGTDRLLYVGGLASSTDTPSDTSFLASSQVLWPDDPSRSEPGPVVFPRSGLCAVALPDGRVVTIGGVEEEFGERHTDPHVEVLVPGTNGGVPAMLGVKALERQRAQHSCTVLEDGAVLIVGGVTEEGDHQTTLGDVILYTPVPLD